MAAVKWIKACGGAESVLLDETGTAFAYIRRRGGKRKPGAKIENFCYADGWWSTSGDVSQIKSEMEARLREAMEDQQNETTEPTPDHPEHTAAPDVGTVSPHNLSLVDRLRIARRDAFSSAMAECLTIAQWVQTDFMGVPKERLQGLFASYERHLDIYGESAQILLLLDVVENPENHKVFVQSLGAALDALTYKPPTTEGEPNPD